ncbi:hypothetical protein E4665_03730 [Sporolactobacillus shoreae]|uniref:Uncharacterized protein n=1 Tax=Sporolactobacillus shoreae TaxID=1465501 RepID=A0A4Z0GS14_9BACL|nr:hypothetical protein [Sporolactobacillus shoreae]TGA99445.1 hypothetical protein E4665_03730 [Sporolactobacillus shoreae]
MLKRLLVPFSITLVGVHLFILYFWIFDWEKLVTPSGLTVWIGSILSGVLIYLIYRKSVHTEKSKLLILKIIFSSTLVTAALGSIALIIEFITFSMP